VRLQQIFEGLHRQFGGADMSGNARLICGDFVDYRDEVAERRVHVPCLPFWQVRGSPGDMCDLCLQVLQANVMFLNNFGGWWSAEKSGPNAPSLENQLIELLKASREGRLNEFALATSRT
jgi:hypothetical protein